MKRIAILLLLCFAGTTLALASGTVHVVKKGETLSAISHRYHVAVADILKHNGLSSGSAIKPGQKLKIPQAAAAKPATAAKAAPAKPKPAAAAKPATAQPETTALAPAAEKMDTIMPEASLEKPDSQARPAEPAKKQTRMSTKTKFFILFVVQTVVSALLAYLIALWAVNRNNSYKRGA
jgi:LysM repeat protein